MEEVEKTRRMLENGISLSITMEGYAQALLGLHTIYETAAQYPNSPQLLLKGLNWIMDQTPQKVQHIAVINATPLDRHLAMYFALSTRKETVPTKEARKEWARERLLSTANTAMLSPTQLDMYNYPRNIVRRRGNSTDYEFQPYSAPPGIPSDELSLVYNQSWMNLALKGGYDFQFQNSVYEREYVHARRAELDSIALKIMTTEKPLQPDPDTMKKLCFLGMKDEESFRKTTEAILLTESAQSGLDTARIRAAIDFAQLSDQARARKDEKKGTSPELCGKRRTGESYYCHPLAVTWYHWTSIRDRVSQGIISPQAATHEIVVALLHDVLEDTPAEYHTDTGKLVLDGTEMDLDPTEYTILQTLTKPSKTDWLEQIKKTAPHLAEVCARLKVSDRSMNTLTEAVTSPYMDGLGKLYETVSVGGHLQEQASGVFNEASFATKMSKLHAALRNGDMYLLFTTLPALAITEAQIVEMQFGYRFYEELTKLSLQNPGGWIDQLIKRYNQITHSGFNDLLQSSKFQQNQYYHPLLDSYAKELHERDGTIHWPHRAVYVADHYKFSPHQLANIHGYSTLADYSLSNYFKSRPFRETPYTHQDFQAQVADCINLQVKYQVVPGIMLGNVDAFVIPRRGPLARLRAA